MLRKSFFITLAASLLLLSGAVAASAQTGELRGHVVIKKADGKAEPVAGAAIDVFRTDLPGKFSTKTDKKGQFVFAGLPYVGVYTIAASAPDASPTFRPGVKAGRNQDYELVMGPGDGRRLTEADIKNAGATAATGSTGGGESAADKAKREEVERKNAEVAAKNKKIEESNAIVARSFKAGNDALIAKNYDEAVRHYDEGLAADPEQPALLTNRALALKARGVERYNAAVTAKDDAAKTSGMDTAKKDFKDAADSANKALELVKAEQPAATDPEGQKRYNANKLSALSARAESMRLFVTKVDQSQADAGLAAYQEYIAAETDPVKKSRAQLDSAQMLLDANLPDKAYAEFQKVLAEKPDDPDANLGAGLSLFSTGDKAKYQQAANFLQKFVDTAPETHKFKADAKAILTELKNTEKVVPQKTETRGRRRG